MKSFDANIEVVIRNMLIKQSGLDSIQVLNAQSIRGIALDKYVEDIKLSLDVNDILLLFRIEQETDEENFGVWTPSEEYVYAIYKVYIVLYGRDGTKLANILRGRIESEKNRIEMITQGAYIQTVSGIATVTEFKNETVWPRTDFDFFVGVKYNIDEVDSYEEMEIDQDIVINNQ